MSVTISEALQQAQEAISSGNYRAAVSTCGQLVQQYPGYSAAHRVLGEAWLEQGQNSEAERSFTAALAGNPRHPWAYLGLGLIAEDRGANEPALAFTQVAWELAPNVAQLREPVRRTAMRRYGSDGQLQFTRAALAQLHAANGRQQRAAAEYRAALEELPERVDLQLGYAEVLWRLGRDSEATAICNSVLEQHHDAVQALVILAEVEHRGGDARRAEAWRTRVRAIDPDGAVTATMLAGHPRADHDWLSVAGEAMPLVQESAAAAPDRPHIAPAPDFEYVPSRPEARVADLDDLRPMQPEEFGAGMPEPPTPDAGFLLDDFEEQPFDPTEIGTDRLLGGAPIAAAAAGLGLAAAFSDDDTPAPPADIEVDELGLLAADLEGDIADALSRTGGEIHTDALLSEDPADNIPPDIAPSGYTTMLRELGDEGHAPFDALDQSMPAPDLSADLPADVAALDAAAAVAGDWDEIDREIQSAVPQDDLRGYTEELRSLEGSGLEPFIIDDAPAGDAAALDALLAEAPAEPDIALDVAALEVADAALLAEPPQAEVVAEEIDVAVEASVAEAAAVEEIDLIVAVEPEAAPPSADAELTDELFADLEPFSAEDFEQGSLDTQTKQFAFTQAPWETGREGAGRSVVPSDADLEELLIAEEAARAEAREREAQAAAAMPEQAAEPQPEPSPQPVEEQAAAPVWTEQSDLDEFFGSSLAVTRALGAEEEPPALVEDVEALATPIDDIGADAGVFERARAGKYELIDTGAIAGNLELAEQAEDVVVEEIVEVDAAGEAAVAEEWVADMPAEDVPDAEDSGDTAADAQFAADAAFEQEDVEPAVVSGTGAFRDPDTLRAALAADPNDAELHWWLGAALQERGDVADAIGEYRWLVRHAPERVDDVIAALTTCIEHQQETATAHRVLADIYRRRGDSARATNHAALAMQSHRRARG